jgi:transposase-like protein
VPSYRGFRYPVEIISHCVWLYHRFPLSFREVEEMMMARRVLVTYETIQQWCRKFRQTYANGLRRRRPRLGVFCPFNHGMLRLGLLRGSAFCEGRHSPIER